MSDKTDWSARCRKCGCTDVEMRYQREWRASVMALAVHDVIVRTCQDCGHEWTQKPLDKLDREAKA